MDRKVVAAAAGGLAAAAAARSFFRQPGRSVKGRTCLVTGAASGVGRALAIELARRGARLVLWDVQHDKLEETRDIVLKQFPKVEVQIAECDLADAADIARAVAGLPWPIEILINNAGVITGGYFTDVDPAKMELTMRVNVLAHMHLVRALMPGMIERGWGHVAGVCSVTALVGHSQMVDYATSKFAARGFMESLAVELHERGIENVKVSCVCPTLIDTGLFKGFHIPFNPTLRTVDVATSVIEAIEYERELVVVPGWLAVPAIGVKALLKMTGQLGIKMPFASGMKNFDSSQAQRAFKAMERRSSKHSKHSKHAQPPSKL